MPRTARVAAEGVPYHITQRGNYRQDVFLLARDARFYLETLRAMGKLHGLSVLGYCLMKNHVHLVVVPHSPEALAKTLGQTHGRYARWLNCRLGRTGHLWQARYYSCPLGPNHLVAALAYVDLNPVRAGIAADAQAYRWSSARAHVEGAELDPLIDAKLWAQLRVPLDWREVLYTENDERKAARIRRATYKGAPLGFRRGQPLSASRIG